MAEQLEQSLGDLVEALENLAMASMDWSAASSARHYLGLLERSTPDRIETILRQLRLDLGSKRDLTDGNGQQTEAYWAAFGEVRRLTRLAMNDVIALRRPDLAFSIQGD